ncbi:RHS repeat-associated core domain-containing protein [Roseimaritima sediminicola]|uniref:RHS repeat-associated core domain-containing protein n=1 Tax=Roseimaritima sediminicola TaxID=2662066 RepID=UPI0013870E2A|nr:RHS repeat-associated core domain-containing protein [Roseimaritima sediminicola]
MRCYQSNQQYSVTALTDTTGAIMERYAYDAYGKLTVTDGSGTTLAGSAYGNRYTYTGREWDGELGLYHYRARMYSPDTGRFVSRDPIGYISGMILYGNYFGLFRVDPTGLQVAAVPGMIEADQIPDLEESVVPTVAPNQIEVLIQQLREEIERLTIEQCGELCRRWVEKEKTKDQTWRKKLKKCPCNQENASFPAFVESPADVNTHPGCATCFRSFEVLPMSAGQQCCYDQSGSLITSGTGGGTVDRITPFNPLGHFIHDVFPYLVCKKASMLDDYEILRPIDQGIDPNGKPCTQNPTPPLQK